MPEYGSPTSRHSFRSLSLALNQRQTQPDESELQSVLIPARGVLAVSTPTSAPAHLKGEEGSLQRGASDSDSRVSQHLLPRCSMKRQRAVAWALLLPRERIQTLLFVCMRASSRFQCPAEPAVCKYLAVW